MALTLAETKLKLKLLVDKRSSKVIYAEAGKGFVDFLFHLLSLPVSTVIRLTQSSETVGSIGNLYSSFKNLNEFYMQSNHSKDDLLKPLVLPSVYGIPIKFTECICTRTLYICTENHVSLTYDPDWVCPCGETVEYEGNFITSEDDWGYVNGQYTYMVMDDLNVTPRSDINVAATISRYNIQDYYRCLEERFVQFGIAEAVELLKASLRTQAVLTGVFLPK